ncbi:MAG: transcriptional regulator, partial [Prevotella sp.]|nr:transcriptional regulator [Prevotella sp.]
IEGKVLDENFAKILVNNPSLSLAGIILLDKVQKHEYISDDSLAYLRKKKYVEGRKPNVYTIFF